MTRALIAMSGGVDSSVAAKLAVDSGLQCIGCTMKLYENEDAGISSGHTCCSLDDVNDARSVAFQLGIPYYVFNFTDSFKEKVIDKFVRSYESGRTPNPCIDCNRYMKFEKLFQRREILDCDYVVTGHYAQIECYGGKYVLKKAVDTTKDQSYVLYDLTQEKLKHVLFPLGKLRKTETRNIAESSGFINARKHDSQDICFVPNGDYAQIVAMHSGKNPQPGDFVNTAGEVIGRHKGIINYTVGQRKGLGIAFNEPMYVCKVVAENNTVILGRERELYQKELFVDNINWISGETPDKVLSCGVKIRYRQPEQPATVIPTGLNTAHIIFDEPQRAVTPGQAAVFYDDTTVLGGGIIR